MKNYSNSTTRRGFTLVELLVAMAITVVIISVLVSITAVAMDTWQRGRAEVRASRQAKAMLETIARDFESMVTRRGNSFEWFYSKVDPSLPGPVANKSSNAAQFTFFTAATDRYLGKVGGTDDRGGDVSCVSYQLKWQDAVQGREDSTSANFILYRLLVDPDLTFKDLLGKPDLETAFSSYASKIGEVENFVCENIYQFTMTYQVEVTRVPTGSSGTTQILPVRVTLGDSGAATEFRVRGDGIETDASTSGISPQVTLDELRAGRLTAVEIGITVLSDSGVIRLNTPNMDQKVRERILSQESFQYTRTVQIPKM